MTPEQAKTMTVGTSVVVPLPIFRSYGLNFEKVGEARVLAGVGARYECPPVLDVEHGGQYMRVADKPLVNGHGYFWAEHKDGLNRSPRRLLVHISEAELVEAV